MADDCELTIDYETLRSNELSPEQLEDLRLARKMRKKAYAPYSNFLVGAVLRTNDGKIYGGSNLETVTFDGLHAEASALGQLSPASRKAGLQRVTVVGGLRGSRSRVPVFPCGACRQKLIEFQRTNSAAEVIIAGIHGRVMRVALNDLLPFAFSPKDLRK